MPMNPVVQAVIKAITLVQPDVASSWDAQRKVEDAAGKLTIADPRAAASTRSLPPPTTATRYPCACSPRSTSTSR